MVFYHHDVAPAPDRLPRYLDLGYYAANDGVPFTQSSNLLSALLAALKRFESAQPFAETAELAHWLRPKLRELGFRILAPDEQSSPAVITLVLRTHCGRSRWAMSCKPPACGSATRASTCAGVTGSDLPDG